jgi:hypothetical protein
VSRKMADEEALPRALVRSASSRVDRKVKTCLRSAGSYEMRLQCEEFEEVR